MIFSPLGIINGRVFEQSIRVGQQRQKQSTQVTKQMSMAFMQEMRGKDDRRPVLIVVIVSTVVMPEIQIVKKILNMIFFVCQWFKKDHQVISAPVLCIFERMGCCLSLNNGKNLSATFWQQHFLKCILNLIPTIKQQHSILLQHLASNKLQK